MGYGHAGPAGTNSTKSSDMTCIHSQLEMKAEFSHPRHAEEQSCGGFVNRVTETGKVAVPRFLCPPLAERTGEKDFISVRTGFSFARPR